MTSAHCISVVYEYIRTAPDQFARGGFREIEYGGDSFYDLEGRQTACGNGAADNYRSQSTCGCGRGHHRRAYQGACDRACDHGRNTESMGNFVS